MSNEIGQGRDLNGADGAEALNKGVTEFCAVVDEHMLAMYAYAMVNFLVDKGILRDLARANAWFLALEHAVFRSFERR